MKFLRLVKNTCGFLCYFFDQTSKKKQDIMYDYLDKVKNWRKI